MAAIPGVSMQGLFFSDPDPSALKSCKDSDAVAAYLEESGRYNFWRGVVMGGLFGIVGVGVAISLYRAANSETGRNAAKAAAKLAVL